MAIQFAHNTQAQLDTRNLNIYTNGAQILKDVNVSIPPKQDYLHHRSFWLRQINFTPHFQSPERPRGRSENEW